VDDSCARPPLRPRMLPYLSTAFVAQSWGLLTVRLTESLKLSGLQVSRTQLDVTRIAVSGVKALDGPAA
jgi:hypothetical protein